MNLICCCWRMAPNTRVTRKWEVFAGRNKFFCDGYLMTAPHSGVFYLTVFLITGTSALFFAFDCPFLAEKITPAIPIVGGLLYLFTMSSLFRTSFTDPGIIPRASHDEAAYIEKQIEVPNSLNSPTYRPPPRTKEVLVKGQTVKLKYCFTCKIFRPPRASHCSLCDNCVDRFDHHCPWVGNCVGKRNYRFFYMFIVSLAFLTVFIFTCSTTHIVLLAKDKNDVTLDAIKEAPFSLIIAIICFLSVWSVIGLAGFHTYLTTSDQTTNEDIKGSFSAKGGPQATNPYSKGNICSNCFHILCGPMTPSLIDRRGVVTDEYRIQMQSGEATKYNVLPTQTAGPPMVVNQPTLGSLENGTNTYNVNNENGTTNPGIYRQQSYENNLNSDKFATKKTATPHLLRKCDEMKFANSFLGYHYYFNKNNNGNVPMMPTTTSTTTHLKQPQKLVPTNLTFVNPQTQKTNHQQTAGKKLQLNSTIVNKPLQLVNNEEEASVMSRYPFHRNRALPPNYNKTHDINFQTSREEHQKYKSVKERNRRSLVDFNNNNIQFEEEEYDEDGEEEDEMVNEPMLSMVLREEHAQKKSIYTAMEYRNHKRRLQQNSSRQFGPISSNGRNKFYQISPPVKRYSNVYEYSYSNPDSLNAINEDSSSDS